MAARDCCQLVTSCLATFAACKLWSSNLPVKQELKSGGPGQTQLYYSHINIWHLSYIRVVLLSSLVNCGIWLQFASRAMAEPAVANGVQEVLGSLVQATGSRQGQSGQGSNPSAGPVAELWPYAAAACRWGLSCNSAFCSAEWCQQCPCHQQQQQQQQQQLAVSSGRTGCRGERGMGKGHQV